MRLLMTLGLLAYLPLLAASQDAKDKDKDKDAKDKGK
jgi:hypothetical protein